MCLLKTKLLCLPIYCPFISLSLIYSILYLPIVTAMHVCYVQNLLRQLTSNNIGSVLCQLQQCKKTSQAAHDARISYITHDCYDHQHTCPLLTS